MRKFVLLTVWAIHVEGSSLLALVPVTAALWVFPQSGGLRADEPLVGLAVLVVGVAHGPVAAVHGEAFVADEGGLVEALLISVRRI